MKYILYLLFLVSSIQTLYAKDTLSVDFIVSDIIHHSKKQDYLKAQTAYSLLVKTIDRKPELGYYLLNYANEFTDIISTLPVDMKDKAVSYVLSSHEICLKGIEKLRIKSSLKECKWLDYISSANFFTYLYLYKLGYVDDSYKFILAATDVYKSKNIITEQYILSLVELSAYYYFNNDFSGELQVLSESIEKAIILFGKDSLKVKRLFYYLLEKYSLLNVFILKYYDGVFNSAVEEAVNSMERTSDERPYIVPDYQQRNNMIKIYKGFKSRIIDIYGHSYYQNLLNSYYNNESNDLEYNWAVGYDSYDSFHSILLAIQSGITMEFHKEYLNIIENNLSTKLKQSYSEIISRHLEMYGYYNLIFEMYDMLNNQLSKAGQKNEIEKNYIKLDKLAAKYGQFTSYKEYLLNIIEKDFSISNGNSPEIYISRIIIALSDQRNKIETKEAISIFSKGMSIIKDFGEDISNFTKSEFCLSYALAFYDIKDYNTAMEYVLKSKYFYMQYVNEDKSFREDYTYPININLLIANIYIDTYEYKEALEILIQCEEFYKFNQPRDEALLHIYEDLIFLCAITENKDLLTYYCNLYNNVSLQYYLHNSFSMDTEQRNKFWYSKSFNYALEIYSGLALNNCIDSLLTLSFDRALIQKGLLVNYNKLIENNILNSMDEELKALYNDFKVSQLLNSYEVKEKEKLMMKRYSTHNEFKENFNFYNWEDVRSSLTTQDIAIEFTVTSPYLEFVNNTAYAVLVLKKDWSTPLIIELCSKAELLKLISTGSKLYQHNDDAYSYIWEKLEPYLDGVENIYFAPHGLIHKMNIEVLAGKDGIPMNKKYNVYRVSSTGNLVDKREDSKYFSATLFGGLNYDTDTMSLLAMSRNYTHISPSRDRLLRDTIQTRAGLNYLPGTATEVKNVYNILWKNEVKTMLFTDEIGTEESFKALSGNSPSIIHIATHGFYLEDKTARRVELFSSLEDRGTTQISPLKRSGLMFSGGQHAWLGKDIPEGIDDGVLTAEEIAGMNLSGTDLLVLSACQTGLGEITSSGVEGLQKGFKIAGVNTIIMSLWEVSDVATETMMTTFYKNLTKGKSKREAFDKAVEAVKKKYPSPEYWAAFVMLD